MKPTVIHAIFLVTRSLWVRFHMTLILLVVVLRATWGPLLIVLCLSVVTGFFVQGKCPSAVKLMDAIRECGNTK